MFSKKTLDIAPLKHALTSEDKDTVVAQLKSLHETLKESPASDRIFEESANDLLRFTISSELIVDDEVRYELGRVMVYNMRRVVPALVAELLGPAEEKRDSSLSILVTMRFFHVECWSDDVRKLFLNAMTQLINNPTYTMSSEFERLAKVLCSVEDAFVKGLNISRLLER